MSDICEVCTAPLDPAARATGATRCAACAPASAHDSGVFTLPSSAAAAASLEPVQSTPGERAAPGAPAPIPGPEPAASKRAPSGPQEEPGVREPNSSSAADDGGFLLHVPAAQSVKLDGIVPVTPPVRSAAQTPAPQPVPATVRVELPAGRAKRPGGARTESASASTATDPANIAAPPRPNLPTHVRVPDFSLPRRLLPWRAFRRRVVVSARKLDFPPICACCLGAADGRFSAVHVRSDGGRGAGTYSWEFPYCQACLDHVRAARLARGLARVTAVAVAVLFGLFAWWCGFAVVGLVAGLAAGGLTAVLLPRKRRADLTRGAPPGCACLGPAVVYDGFHGTLHRFRFAQAAYENAFRAANAEKLR